MSAEKKKRLVAADYKAAGKILCAFDRQAIDDVIATGIDLGWGDEGDGRFPGGYGACRFLAEQAAKYTYKKKKYDADYAQKVDDTIFYLIEKYDANPGSASFHAALEAGLFRTLDYLIQNDMVDLEHYGKYLWHLSVITRYVPESVEYLAKHGIVVPEYVEEPAAAPKPEEEKKEESKALKTAGDCNPQVINADALSQTTLKITASYIIETNTGHYGTLHMGGNRIGVFSSTGEWFIPALDVVDVAKGELLWRVKGVIDGDYTSAIYDDKAIYVPRNYQGRRFISAHNPETGELLWECKLSNSYKQFGTLLAQTADYIAHANRDNSKLYITRKDKGKLVGRIDLKNPIEEWEINKSIVAWNNRFFVFSYNEQGPFYYLDEYDAASGAFVKTLAKIKANEVKLSATPFSARLLWPTVIGDYLYVLMTDGCMVKINLPDGKIEKQTLSLPEDANVFLYAPTYDTYRELITQVDGKLHYGFDAKPGNMGFQYFTYNLATDEITRYDIGDAVKDYPVCNVATRAGIVYCFGFGTNGYNNGREVAIYSTGKKDFIAQLTLPDLDGKDECDRDDMTIMTDRQESHAIVGNSIFVAQLGGEKYGDENVVLHQII